MPQVSKQNKHTPRGVNFCLLSWNRKKCMYLFVLKISQRISTRTKNLVELFWRTTLCVQIMFWRVRIFLAFLRRTQHNVRIKFHECWKEKHIFDVLKFDTTSRTSVEIIEKVALNQLIVDCTNVFLNQCWELKHFVWNYVCILEFCEH